MTRFLLNKPIAVSMIFIAILALGLVALTRIPVSLMPDIAIPQVTIQVNYGQMPARELENSIVRGLRQQLMQVSHLDDITSETVDGNSIIRLLFHYGANINLAFIEVNEKIDRAMSGMPRDIERPRVIKANVSDVPVFYLNLTLKSQPVNSEWNSTEEARPANTTAFVELSRFAGHVIRKRLEQLPEVAMVDLTGLVRTEIAVIPDMEKISSLGLTLENIEATIRESNVRLGHLMIKDGQYMYNVRVSSSLSGKGDIKDLFLKAGDRILQLKDIAEITEQPRKLTGMAVTNGKPAVVMAVIKQQDARMDNLKKSLHSLIGHFEKDYPNIHFEVTRDQTRLLQYSIANLKQSLFWGAILAFVIMFLFLRDVKSPLLIGITIPLSLMVSLLFFYLFGLTLNIVSLSGLILGLGMMVDNSIIVIDNITQHWHRLTTQKGTQSSNLQPVSPKPLNQQPETPNKPETLPPKTLYPQPTTLHLACTSGTNEVIRPMLAAVLTTCAVFIPLIFLGGIGGALFYDQAMAVAIGLFASLIVSITILPVYFLIFYRKSTSIKENRWLTKMNPLDYTKWYSNGFTFVMRNQIIAWLVITMLLTGTVILFKGLPRSKLPLVKQDDFVVQVDWNDPIHLTENQKRCQQLLTGIDSLLVAHTSLIGEQQFMLDKDGARNPSSAAMYIKAVNPGYADEIKSLLMKRAQSSWPDASLHFDEAENIFNVIFPDMEPPLLVKLHATNEYSSEYLHYLEKAADQVNQVTASSSGSVMVNDLIVLEVSAERLLLYEVSFSSLRTRLKTLFSEHLVTQIMESTDFMPVILGGKPTVLNEILNKSFVMNRNGDAVQIADLITRAKATDLKKIVAGKDGVYYPIAVNKLQGRPEHVMVGIKEILQQNNRFEASFSGSIFTNRQMIKQLLIILIIAVALLYFILAAQFESLTMPFIILIEIPVALFGVLFFLWIFGGTINIMSLIGIVVTAGIIINDSILKLDTVNLLRKEGYSLLRSLKEAGNRRLKPILMTSLTTILAMTPLLFASGVGADLQRPLAIAVIGGMVIGTIISLYLIPLCYYYFHVSRK